MDFPRASLALPARFTLGYYQRPHRGQGVEICIVAESPPQRRRPVTWDPGLEIRSTAGLEMRATPNGKSTQGSERQ